MTIIKISKIHGRRTIKDGSWSQTEVHFVHAAFMHTIVYGIKKENCSLDIFMVSENICLLFLNIFLNIWLIEKKDQPAYEISLVHLLIYFCVVSLEASCT